MRKFIVLSFILLGVAFYELSGGSDFEPVERQVIDVSFADNGNGIALQSVSAPAKRIVEPVVTTISMDQLNPAQQDQAVVTRISTRSTPVTADPAPVAAPQVDLATVTGSAVNMRLGPSTQYGVVDTLRRGTQVEILEIADNGWARLRVVDGGKVGWMSARFVAETGA